MSARGIGSGLEAFADGIHRATGWIDQFVQVCLIITLSSMYLLIMTQIGLRYLIFMPIVWVEEVAEYSLPLLALWGTATCFRQGAHLRVGVLVDILPSILRRFVALLVYALVFYFAWKVTMSGLALAELGRAETVTSGTFSLYWPRMAIVVGGVLIMIQVGNLVLQEALGRAPASEKAE